MKVKALSFIAEAPTKPFIKLVKTLLWRKAVVSEPIATISLTTPVTVVRLEALIARDVAALIDFNSKAVAEAFKVISSLLVEEAVKVANSVLVSVLTIEAKSSKLVLLENPAVNAFA